MKLLFTFFISIFLFISLFIFAAEALPAPTIAVYPDVYYPFDEVLYLEGSAKPASVVELQLTKQGARPETFRTKSDARGEWVFAEKIPLAAGEWEVRARIAEGASPSLTERGRSRDAVAQGGGVRGTGFRLV